MAVTAALLAGCAAPDGGGTQAGAAPPGFACPPTGTVIAFADGRRLTYGGAATGDPFVCEARRADGGTARMLANHFEVPLQDEANIRRGMAALFPLRSGSSTSFVRDRRTADGALVRFSESWRVLREGSAEIGGVTRSVLLIEHAEEIPQIGGYSGVWTYLYDTEARAIVGGDLRVIRGVNRAPNWRAASVSVPR
ncbi:hypothetical protein [Falsiroseomonas oryziterrae]|uniref:hypothetical protein n=1 Tax=Falsiroseomonas oryziterrae TaxID=2911368 RepID=UPI001F2234FA|nr:hypothetical protein [Roseomonas sp. NPKOSM-4]